MATNSNPTAKLTSPLQPKWINWWGGGLAAVGSVLLWRVWRK